MYPTTQTESVTDATASFRFGYATDFKAPIDVVADYIWQEPSMAKWVPMHKNVVYTHKGADNRIGVGSVRRVTLLGGFYADEKILRHEPGKLSSYGIVGATINPWGLLKGHQAYMQISALPGGGTHLNWSTHFDPRPGMGLLLPPLKALTAHLIRTMMRNMEADLGLAS